MKPLNRPMFRMGGPIKEGIMDGIQEPRRRYNQGAFGTSAYTQEDYDNFLQRVFVNPPPSESTIPGLDRTSMFFNQRTDTPQRGYKYEDLFKEGESIFDANIFDFAKAGIPGEKFAKKPKYVSPRTENKIAFSTALKEDILSKLPKMEPAKGGGADFADVDTITEEDIVDDDYYTKGELPEDTSNIPGSFVPDEKRKIVEDPDDKKLTDRKKLREILGYDRAVKRGNYQLIEAIRRGLTEGGVQGALDAAFASGATAYDDADKIKQIAALKEYERETAMEDDETKRKRALSDSMKLAEYQAKIKKQYGTDKTGKSIEEKRNEFGKKIGLTGNDLDIFTRGAKTIDENILTALSKSTYGTLDNVSLFSAVAASIGAGKVINIDKDPRFGTRADIPQNFPVGNYVIEGTTLYVVGQNAAGEPELVFQADYGSGT